MRKACVRRETEICARLNFANPVSFKWRWTDTVVGQRTSAAHFAGRRTRIKTQLGLSNQDEKSQGEHIRIQQEPKLIREQQN